MKEKIATALVMAMLNLFSIYAIYKIFDLTAIDHWYVYTIIGYLLIQMVGINAGYHRMLTHSSFETYVPVKRILMFLGMLGGQGSPIFWGAIHRGIHHRYTDTEKDIHSPVNGFWNSYVLWTTRFTSKDINVKSVIHLIKDPDCAFLHKHYILIFFASHIAIALVSFDLWLYLVVLPALLSLHGSGIQTSFTHLTKMGYRNYQTSDNSVNVPAVFPFILGDAWHNNHHGEPRNPNFGRRWWELDPTYWFIKFIRTDGKK